MKETVFLGGESVLTLLPLIILVVVVIFSALTDLKKQRILNIVTFPAILAGLVFGLINQGGPGLVNCLVGLLVGFSIFLMMHILGQMGAGDVKLMAAVGALGGFPFILYALFLTVLAGGIISLALALWEGRLWQSFKNIYQAFKSALMPGVPRQPLSQKNSTPVPYACAVCLGSIGAVLADIFSLWS